MTNNFKFNGITIIVIVIVTIIVTYIFSSYFNRYSFEKVDDQYGGQCLIKIDNFEGLTCSVTDNNDCRYMYLICEESKNSFSKNILKKSGNNNEK